MTTQPQCGWCGIIKEFCDCNKKSTTTTTATIGMHVNAPESEIEFTENDKVINDMLDRIEKLENEKVTDWPLMIFMAIMFGIGILLK